MMAPTRPVMGLEEAKTLAPKLFALLDPVFTRVTVEHVARTLTRIVDGRVMSSEDGDTVNIQLRSLTGSGIATSIELHERGPRLERIVAELVRTLPPPLVQDDADQETASLDEDVRKLTAVDPPPLPVVDLWHQTTLDASIAARETTIPAIVRQLRASGVSGSATLGFYARSIIHYQRSGRASFAEETDAELTVTARTSDGPAMGWSGQAHRDWTKMTPDRVVAQAVAFANRSRKAEAIEPQRRTVILSPVAVGELIGAMARLFDFKTSDSPFASDTPGRLTKLGQRVIDPRLTLRSDPADPDGGYEPFLGTDGVDGWMAGFPTPAVTWIDRGVLQNLCLTVREAARRNLTPSEFPYAVRLMPAAGVPTMTIDEMIAQCDQGVYVNRLNDVMLLEGKSALMTGTTRDGCFLIKGGKIDRAIKNFRFVESPMFALNNVLAIGQPERVAFGLTIPAYLRTWQSEGRGWPRLPMIMPALMVKDFNFTALADAV